MRRHAIGVIAIGLLAGAVLLRMIGAQEVWEAACIRVGAVMALWWVAYPDLRRLPAWMVAAAPIVLVLVAVRPRRFVLLVPLLVAAAVLWPRPRRPRK